ncbi:MAG TPA: roadblock/LC7 domain-containing protein [Anaerolineaceae bacterium]|nr:roadblock/LC7 domain-containing protein [Anaerolineaceae bacterium]
MVATTKLTFTMLQDLLINLNNQGGFSVTVLTDHNGFPIASSARNGSDSDTQAAVVSQVRKVAGQVRDQLGMAAAEEFSMNDVNGKKLICRSFPIGDQEYILAILIPNRDKSYRRLTTLTIRAIQNSWDA